MTLVLEAGLSTMLTNSLLRGGYISMDDVCVAEVSELLRLEKLGQKSITEIEEWARINKMIAGDDRFRLERAASKMRMRIVLMQRDLTIADQLLSSKSL